MEKSTREHFRIVYPVGHGPLVKSRDGNMILLDVAEYGVRLGVSETELWRTDVAVRGEATLLCGAKIKINGKVLRLAEKAIVLRLVDPIDLKTMYDEHRFIIQKFGKG